MKKKRSLITAKVSLIIIGLIYFLHLFISLPSKWEKNLDYLKGNALAPYPPGPSNYFQAALWAKEHIPKDAVFMTRKPNMFYYFSKHKSISYPLTQDSLEFQRSLEKNKVQYIVFNSSFIWDPVYLGPFIVANQNRMRVILKTSHPEVHLIEYLQDIDSSQKDLSLETLKISEDAIKIAKENFGPDHPNVAIAINNLAEKYRTQKRYSEAETLYKEALTIWEKAFEPENPCVAAVLSNLALLYKAQEKYSEAESLFNRALTVWEKTYGYEHLYVGTTLSDLADIYASQGRYSEAKLYYARALSIYERVLGKEHIKIADVLEKYALVLMKTNQSKEAKTMQERAKRIKSLQRKDY